MSHGIFAVGLLNLQKRQAKLKMLLTNGTCNNIKETFDPQNLRRDTIFTIRQLK